MANPQFPIDITANDKTRPAFDRVRSNARGVAGATDSWDKKLLAATRPLDSVHKSVRRIVEPMRELQDAWKAFSAPPKGIAQLNSATGALNRSLRQKITPPNLGDVANDNSDATAKVTGGMNATRDAAEATGAGVEGMSDSMGAGALALLRVGTAAAGVTAVVAGAGVAAMAAAAKWDSSVTSLSNLSKSLGINIVDLQAWKIAADQAGVKPDDMATAVGGLRQHANAVRLGQDPNAQAILQNYGVDPQTFAAKNFNDQIATIGAIVRKQKDAQMQAFVADQFGLGNILALLRQDPAKTQAAIDNAKKTGNLITQPQADADIERNRHERRVMQTLGGAGNVLGQMLSDAMRPVWAGADYTMQALGGNPDALTAAMKRHPGGLAATGPSMGPIGDFIARMFQSGEAARARASAATPAVTTQVAAGLQPAFEAFARSIEKQESGGHQSRRPGVPLISPAGAVGAMQLLPATAAAAAARLGVPFDPQKLLHDKAYNEMLGRAELKRLYDKYQGNQVLAAAAYNAGEGVLDGPYRDRHGRLQTGWRQRFGDPLKGEISNADFAERIPFAETRNYVAATAGAGGTPGVRSPLAPAVGPLLGFDLAAQMATFFGKVTAVPKPAAPAPVAPLPQKLEVVVSFANAPAGTTATAHAPGVGPVPVKIGHSQVGRG